MLDEQARQAAEATFTALVLAALTRWLRRVRDVVLAPWRLFRSQPDPTGMYSTQPQWNEEVDTLVEQLQEVARRAWEAATDAPFVSTDSFIQAQLAQTRNLLVRIPDEVYNLIFAEISDGVNAGEDIRQIAERIDNVLNTTASERWPNRARLIAVTEVNRAGNAGALAAGFQNQRIEGTPLFKRWLDSSDRRVRPTHRKADGQQVPLEQPFIVGGFPLMFPGDPTGPPEEVIGCRCSLLVVEAGD